LNWRDPTPASRPPLRSPRQEGVDPLAGHLQRPQDCTKLLTLVHGDYLGARIQGGDQLIDGLFPTPGRSRTLDLLDGPRRRRITEASSRCSSRALAT
jgi:hypothetical protein